MKHFIILITLLIAGCASPRSPFDLGSTKIVAEHAIQFGEGKQFDIRANIRIELYEYPLISLVRGNRYVYRITYPTGKGKPEYEHIYKEKKGLTEDEIRRIIDKGHDTYYEANKPEK